MRKLVIANLKVNHTYEEMRKYKDAFSRHIDNLIICPSYIYLDLMKSDNYNLGAQDGFYFDKGAYTGEVSFFQLKSMGVEYSIIGHSERRYKIGETDEIINKKLIACINNGITPILCIGETKEEKESNKTLEVIEAQIRGCLADINTKEFIIAYEPVWAIGTGLEPTTEEIDGIHLFIKNTLQNIYNIKTTVMYGGSVNISNVKKITDLKEVDGVLIGGASNDPNNLLNIIKEIEM